MASQWFGTIGLFLNLAGVIALFRYGMPFEVKTKGVIYRTITQTDETRHELEKRYTLLGNLGLVAIIVGTAMQAIALWAT